MLLTGWCVSDPLSSLTEILLHALKPSTSMFGTKSMGFIQPLLNAWSNNVTLKWYSWSDKSEAECFQEEKLQLET